MKKILYYLIFLFAVALSQSCGTETELPVFTEDDYPRILGRWPEKSGNQPGMMGGRVGIEFTWTVQFTPSTVCKGVWFLDGEEYTTGTTFSYTPEEPGEHHILLEVTTPKYSTSREAILRVQ
jgi:hypothetical protein